MTDNLVSFEPLLSADSAAELLSIHPGTLTRWAREGRIPCIHLGRKVSFRASALNRWLEEQVQSTSASRAA